VSDDKKYPPIIIDLGAALKKSIERTPAVSPDADRIAALEAELAEAKAEAAKSNTERMAALAAVKSANAEVMTSQAEAAWEELHDRHCGVACCDGVKLAALDAQETK
jgi:hypothetical protein